MKTRTPVVVAFLAGVTLAAGALQVLHAETRPPAYVVSEIDVMDDALYNRGYVPLAAKALVDAGGKFIVRDGRSVSLFGTPPKRIAVVRFDSLKKAEAALYSTAYKEAKKTGDEFRQLPNLRHRRRRPVARRRGEVVSTPRTMGVSRSP